MPTDAWRPAELLPGRALFSIACIEYIDNDLGDYNEVSLAFFVREKRVRAGLPYIGTAVDLLRSRLGTFIHWLPVNQAFTREAGERIWGFPKTTAEIEFFDYDGRRECRLSSEGRMVLSFSTPFGGTAALPESSMTTYSMVDGRPHKTRFGTAATGVGFARGSAARLELGDQDYARRLRSLGLPKKAFFCVSMGHMRGLFESAEPL